MDTKAVLVEAIRLFWRRRILILILIVAASVVLTITTASIEPKTRLTYQLVVNPEVAQLATMFQMISDSPDVRANMDELKWSVRARRKMIFIPGVTSDNEITYKKIMADALHSALQRLNQYSSDVIETAELSHRETTDNANELSRDVLRAKLFNRYFENDQKMIAYFNVNVKYPFVFPTWLLILLYLPICFGFVALALIACAAWRAKMPEVFEFFKTEIAN